MIRTVAIAVAVAAIVAVTAIVVTMTVGSAASKPLLDPANVTNDGIAVTSVTGTGIPDGTAEMGEAGETPVPAETPAAAPTPDASATAQPAVDIRVYVDYLSPGSREVQLANAPQLSTWVTQGAAQLSYYPVAMLTSKSNGTKYSLRASSAAACVATHSPDSFFAFTHALLEQQPEVDARLADTELADLAIASGASSPKVVRACIEDEDFAGWAKTATDRALAGIPGTDDVALTGTPMILVNGAPYVGALDDPAEFSSSSSRSRATATTRPRAPPLRRRPEPARPSGEPG